MIWLFKDSAFLTYWPPEPVRLDPAIATLIGKSASLEIEGGDVVLIPIRTRSFLHAFCGWKTERTT